GRPDEIHGWIKSARRTSPNIKNMAVFVAKYEGWWKKINPKWRVTGDGRLAREEKGTWDEMAAPGPNGFLNVLICLKWWKAGGGEGDWPDAVADVTWVLERLRAK
ncbi:hypothetical protein C8R47DRAFT_997431, partial [Mycena vitilis]